MTKYARVRNSAMQYGKYKKCQITLIITNIGNNYQKIGHKDKAFVVLLGFAFFCT